MRLLALAIVLTAACSSDDHAKPDAPVIPPDAGPIDLASLMPRAVASDATAILAAPKVVAITYANDTNRATIEAFYGAYSASPAWAAQTAEYGVGPITVSTPQHLAGNAPATITDAAVVALLTQNLTGTTPAWGAADPGTLYSFFFPTGTIVDDGTGSLCCTDYDGYHYDATVGGVDVAYAIQCQCPGFDGANITDIEQLTVVAGHEAVEAVTDPHPATSVGWGQADDAHAVWSYITGGEIADLCEFADTAYLLTPANLPDAIQRTWSNAAAAAGHDPCVSEAAATYYQTIPDQADPIQVSIFGDTVTSKGTKIAIGATGSLALHVVADDASAGPFTVTIRDVNQEYFGGNALLTFTQPSGTFHPGETFTITATVVAADPDLKGEAYEVATKPATGPATFFYGLIGQ